jgi:hypothetical protein
MMKSKLPENVLAFINFLRSNPYPLDTLDVKEKSPECATMEEWMDKAFETYRNLGVHEVIGYTLIRKALPD